MAKKITKTEAQLAREEADKAQQSIERENDDAMRQMANIIGYLTSFSRLPDHYISNRVEIKIQLPKSPEENDVMQIRFNPLSSEHLANPEFLLRYMGSSAESAHSRDAWYATQAVLKKAQEVGLEARTFGLSNTLEIVLDDDYQSKFAALETIASRHATARGPVPLY